MLFIFCLLLTVSCSKQDYADIADAEKPGMIHGQVSLEPSISKNGSIVLILFDKNDPPLPLGTGNPSLAIIPRNSENRSFLFGRVKRDHEYEIRAFLDHNENFYPLLDHRAGADFNDVVGGHVQIDQCTGAPVLKKLSFKELRDGEPFFKKEISNVDILGCHVFGKIF